MCFVFCEPGPLLIPDVYLSLIISFQSFDKSGTHVPKCNGIDQVIHLKPNLTEKGDKPLRQRQRWLCGQTQTKVEALQRSSIKL